MPRSTPRFAQLLVERLAPIDKRESLLGDLTERFQGGRSSLWFWRQAIHAILAGMSRDVRRHPDEVFHAVCSGCGAVLLFNALVMSPLVWFTQRIALESPHFRASGNLWFPGFLLLCMFCGGWLAGRIVARFHRGRLATGLSLIVLFELFVTLPRVFSLSVDAWGYWNYRAQLVWQVVGSLVPITGVVTGGLWRMTAEMPAGRVRSD